MAIKAASRYIKATDCGSTVLFTHCPFRPPTEARIRRLDDERYVVVSTSEVRRYRDRSETKGDNLDSVRRSFNRLKSLINANCDSPESVRFVTLTYADNMGDNSKISGHMQWFFRQMHGLYGPFEYVYVKEKQARGAWHLHCVLFFDGKAPYMPNTEEDHPVRDAWGHGWVNVQGFRGSINNLGNYLSAYLTDDEATGRKGARLANYESGIRLYNCSKGIRRPDTFEVTHDQYRSFAEDDTSLLVSERDSGFLSSEGSRASVSHQIFIRI